MKGLRILVAAASASASACAWGTMSPQEFAEEYGQLSSVPHIGRSLFSAARAGALPEMLEGRLGGRIRAQSLTLYANSVMLHAFDPRRPQELNIYGMSDDDWQRPVPLPASAAEPTFDLRDVPFARLPDMVERTRRQFSRLRGLTPYVVADRASSGRLHITVHCSAPRGDGRLVFNADGTLATRP